jgi:hypothetical protein
VTADLAVPVVLVLFNRTDPLERVVATIRQARPRLLLVVADGPRPGHPTDAARCRAARALVEQVDWPGEVRWNAADANLGCDARIGSGLDWAFSQVEEAIVLEDDVVVDPTFFGWCAAMLARYRHDADMVHVAGRNELGRWSATGGDHLVVRRGSIWGWATWARAWQGVDRAPASRPEAVPAARGALASLGLPELLANHLHVQLDAAEAGALGAWDVCWSLCRVLAGGLSVIPPVNLVTNAGFGADASRTVDPDDLRGILRSEPLPPGGATGERPAVDPTYDRWSLLVELMATYRDPAMVARLARSRSLLADERLGRTAAAAVHHLSPFADPPDTLALVGHLAAHGVRSPTIDAVEAHLRSAVDS